MNGSGGIKEFQSRSCKSGCLTASVQIAALAQFHYDGVLATELLAIASAGYVPAQARFTGADLGSATLQGSVRANPDGMLSTAAGGEDFWNYWDNW